MQHRGIYPIDAGRASLMSTVVPFNERLGEEVPWILSNSRHITLQLFVSRGMPCNASFDVQVVVRFFVHPRREGDDFASLVSTLQDAILGCDKKER